MNATIDQHTNQTTIYILKSWITVEVTVTDLVGNFYLGPKFLVTNNTMNRFVNISRYRVA